ATRTWVTKTIAETDSDGTTHYITKLVDAYKVSGDSFYMQDGKAVLPLGTLTVEETKAPNGYLLEGAYMQAGDKSEQIKGLYVTQITEDGDLAVLSGSNQFSVSDKVIRGGVKIQKRDLETGDTKPQGSATLKDTAFDIISLNDNSVLVEGKLYKKNEVVKTIRTDIEGIASTSSDLLPYGKFCIVESEAPDGYLTDGAKPIDFTITENGKIVDLTDETHSIYNQIKRGDIEGVKIGAGTHKRLADVPFRITSKTTGENHVVVTDDNGQFSTSADWASHKHNTNAGKTSEDGVWFGTSEPDDSKGACVIEESQRYLRLEHEDKESYVSYFTVNAIVGELDFPSSEIFYFQQQQFTFPVDTSMNVEIVENRKALTTVRNKKKELKDLDNHAYQAGSETSSNVVDALDSVNELETDLDQSKESMYKLSYVIRVSAPDLDELKRRCDEVKDFYDDLNVKLVRPAGDMLGLHSEFLPASKRYINDYVQYVKSDFLAGLGFGATQQLGENTGIYIGYSVDTGRNVYLQPSLASQGVKGTVTNALASAFVGSLGGGKSFCNNLLVYYSVLFGGQAVILDPKSERGNWKETLPEIAHEINIVNLTSDKGNAGLLDPFVIMKNVKDAESLAIDILTFLTGISSRDGEKFPVLRKAVRSVTQSANRGLLYVIEELRKEDTAISRNIADHIDSFTDYDFAHLLFSDGTVENAISLDNQLNIIQVADLVLPDKDTTFEEYTTIELLSVSMLIVISTFALDFIHSDRSIFKIVDLDEAWAFLNVAQGETLSNKLVRAGRAMQAGVYFVTQSSGDVSKESLKNNIGLKFAFRSTDINEIKQTLEFFGIDKDDENNQKRLRDLENGQCLLQDLYGRVGVVQIHPVFEELLHAFDTRPPVQRNEVE
ncbi:conjugal transfer ATPase TcpF, partial [Coprococcus comes]